MNLKRDVIKRSIGAFLVLLLALLLVLPFILRHNLKGTQQDFAGQRGRWRAILQEEREKERPLYLPEDCMIEMFQPEEWDVSYVPESLPDGYIVDGLDIIGNYGSEDMAISYMFYELVDKEDANGLIKEESKITFTQSKNDVYNTPIVQPNTKDELIEGEYSHRKWKEENMVYWREGDILFCVQGDYEYAFLEEMADRIVVYEVVN